MRVYSEIPSLRSLHSHHLENVYYFQSLAGHGVTPYPFPLLFFTFPSFPKKQTKNNK